VCEYVGGKSETAFIFCLKTTQLEATKSTLDLAAGFKKIKINATPNLKPLTLADREAQDAHEKEQLRQRLQEQLRSHREKDELILHLQRQLAERARVPKARQQLPFGANQPPATHPHDEDILATEHDINDVSPDTSNQEEDVSDQEEEEPAQPTVPQILQVPAVFVSEQTDSEEADEEETEEETDEEETDEEETDEEETKGETERETEGETEGEDEDDILLPSDEQKLLLGPLLEREDELYERDRHSHIDPVDMANGDYEVGLTQDKLRDLLRNRPEEDVLQWMETQFTAGNKYYSYCNKRI